MRKFCSVLVCYAMLCYARWCAMLCYAIRGVMLYALLSQSLAYNCSRAQFHTKQDQGSGKKGRERESGKESERMRKKGKGKADEPGRRRKTGLSESGFRFGFDSRGGGAQAQRRCGKERYTGAGRPEKRRHSRPSVNQTSRCENVGIPGEDVNGQEMCAHANVMSV